MEEAIHAADSVEGMPLDRRATEAVKQDSGASSGPAFVDESEVQSAVLQCMNIYLNVDGNCVSHDGMVVVCAMNFHTCCPV